MPSLATEQYRRLAGSLHELQVQRNLKTLMVTSAVPHEGKTLTVVNLALTLAEAYGRRVLLVDADLRRPFIHDLFRLKNDRGLGDVLGAGGEDLPFQQLTESLTVLTAGHAEQPMEALTSEAMRVLLDRAAATFDWVLLDAAPIGLIPDARLLAALTRAVVFVIGARSTPHALVTKALAEIDPEFLVGTVLNRVQEHDMPATEYYKDYYSQAE
jgi:capsular exopolysaccharide synthesis family protein